MFYVIVSHYTAESADALKQNKMYLTAVDVDC